MALPTEEDLPPYPRSPALMKALRLLGNPWASLQVIEIPARAPRSIAIADDKGSNPPLSSRAESSVPELSKVEFEKECRRIFRQYIPALEKGRTRPHHRHFISRNSGRAPGIRYALVDKLRRYDLGDIQGFQAHFNRERDPFTEAKLREIELAVSGRNK